MQTKRFHLRPRNDMVVLRLRDLGISEGGVAIPEASREGKEWRVVAVGSKVEGLKPNDRVEPMGEIGQDIARIPGYKGFYILKEVNILLVHEEEGK
jgi:hypothetical protein